MDLLREIDDLEISSLETLRSTIQAVSDDHNFYLMSSILLQRRLASLEFTKSYDILLETVDFPRAKSLIRRIIREEYPNRTSSHREDLVYDLCLTGIPRIEAIFPKPTKATQQILRRLDRELRKIIMSDDCEAVSLLFLRAWGEISTAIEYETLWNIWLSRFMSDEANGELPRSCFYWYHFEHDRMVNNLTSLRSRKSDETTTHADDLGRFVVRAFEDRAQREAPLHAVRAAYALKIDFYRQFER